LSSSFLYHLLPLLLLFQVFPFLLGDSTLDGYSELIHSEVGVIIEPMLIISNASTASSRARCSLTLHKYLCSSNALRPNDTIAWNTRLCLKWKCKVEHHAMRIENCWVGSVNNPVPIIGKDGCTAESAMLHSPRYDTSFRGAESIGWLSVRQVGMKHIHMSCTIRLCHFCDPECQENTPPRSCVDQPRLRDFGRMWNESSAVSRTCNPTPYVTASPMNSLPPSLLTPLLTLLTITRLLLS
ncbi:hypothetical protein PMAYCL1PPCAC_12161, partial [Pristionchus mayeri]